MSGISLPPRAQCHTPEAPEYLEIPSDVSLWFTVNGLRHVNSIVAYDTSVGWITFHVIYQPNTPCPHCNHWHPMVRQETKYGMVRIFDASDYGER